MIRGVARRTTSIQKVKAGLSPKGWHLRICWYGVGAGATKTLEATLQARLGKQQPGTGPSLILKLVSRQLFNSPSLDHAQSCPRHLKCPSSPAMFSSAIKSFTSNISANYKISDTPTAISGPWKIYDAKKKSTGKVASVFVFEKKSLDARGSSGFGGRSGNTALKRAQDEVVERLKKEASSLARLRHPCILEFVEPVEETRSGGLMFATEQVIGSLAVLLEEHDRTGGSGGSTRRNRYTEDSESGSRDFEIDELEIQKGLLQVGKALEFLHESAGLVHANLTLDAIFVNAKVRVCNCSDKNCN
jgi:serine/threonine protein kinase